VKEFIERELADIKKKKDTLYNSALELDEEAKSIQ